ncbi:MAG TPA: addiction module protein [Ferruginibacter sp.]|nr:addiction module protein [Ferruginibacter sp.]
MGKNIFVICKEKMSYNKKELLNLPAEEKQELAEALWNSIENNNLPATEDEIAFANERYNIHLAEPEEGIEWMDLKEKIKAKYGF